MTGEARGLHISLARPRQERLHTQMVLALVFFASLHFYFGGLLALSGWLPPLILGEALIAAGYLLGKSKKVQGVALGAAAALALAALCLLPEAREGAKRLGNQLFSLSEARNRYTYTRFAVSAEAMHGVEIFQIALAVIGAAISVVIVNGKSKAGALLLATLIVGTEVYFGVVPDARPHLLLFLCLAAILVSKGEAAPSLKGRAWLLVITLAIGSLVGLLFPGVDPALESRSEQLRDWFSQALTSRAGEFVTEDSSNQTRKEGLLAEEESSGLSDESPDGRGYERVLMYRQDISNPRPVDYLRIAALLLLIIALLLAPFLPFFWLDRRRRRAMEMRADFDAPDCSRAILAMFRHIVRCLAALGFSDESRGFLRLLPEGEPRISDGYRAEYRRAALLWGEAAYSDHAMTEEQKETVLSLQKETARLIYSLSGKRARFRLKYVDCLILPEDTV